jgi:hypothetical protein
MWKKMFSLRCKNNKNYSFYVAIQYKFENSKNTPDPTFWVTQIKAYPKLNRSEEFLKQKLPTSHTNQFLLLPRNNFNKK